MSINPMTFSMATAYQEQLVQDAGKHAEHGFPAARLSLSSRLAARLGSLLIVAGRRLQARHEPMIYRSASGKVRA